ncbi:MAG: hypothetical protein ACK4GN_09530 [Runella sp.]
MKKTFDFRRWWPHLAVLAGFAVLSVGYMAPILKGKVLVMGDPSRFKALQSEIHKYAGEFIGWTNSLFGGMPTYFIGGDYSEGIFIKIQPFLYNLLSLQGTYIFLYLVGAYLLLKALQCNVWISILGAIGYAFYSYNIQIIEAGHLAKIYALAFVPVMLAGLVWGFRGRSWLGAALLSLGVGLEINANHFQITYYSAIIIAALAIWELVQAIKTKKIAHYLTFGALALVLSLCATATNTARLWTTLDHSKETIRGGSELTPKATAQPTKKADGLDKEYAFAWSYGKLESLTFLIPNFSGGASGGELDTKSESYKVLTRLGVDDANAAQFVRQLPTYWGDQTFVGGGVYAGAIICFLFVLGLFYAESRYKWPFAVAGLICLFIGWGSNLSFFNYFLFDHFPMFNKFRAVSMILSLVQLCMVVIAALGLKNIVENPPTWTDFKKPFFVSLGVTAGVALVLGLVPSLVGLRSDNDPAFVEQIAKSFGDNRMAADQLYNALLDDRASMLRADAFRSVFFIVLAALVLWAFVAQKLKKPVVLGSILVGLTLIDLWVVNKRYLNADDFRPKYEAEGGGVQMTAADEEILKDPDPHYRVYDVTSGPFTDPRASAFHKSIGGYSASKLRRYQDLIEYQLAKNNMAVLNMLNAKYIIIPGQNNQTTAQRNPDALGNAWFVRNLQMVANADEEMKALDNFNPRTTAIVDQRFADLLKGAKPSADTSGYIRLTSYHPDKLEYEYESNTPQIVVFSEVYYKGNEDWISMIDGQIVPHFRANYVLRAMAVPAGKHKITFKFDPKTVREGQKYDRWASIAWLLLAVGALVMDFRQKNKMHMD